MPNRETHLGIALLILIVYYFVLSHLSLDYFYYGLSVFVGAILPDILDPWSKENRYNHRGFGHSKRLLKPLWIISGVSLILSIFLPIFLILLMFSLGYLSHLLADSIKTKSWSRGLPD